MHTTDQPWINLVNQAYVLVPSLETRVDFGAKLSDIGEQLIYLIYSIIMTIHQTCHRVWMLRFVLTTAMLILSKTTTCPWVSADIER